MRTLLSLSGMIVGVAAVILMVSVGRGAEKRILERIRSLGVNLIMIKAGLTQILAGRERQVTHVTTLVPDDAAAIMRECSSAELAAPAVARKTTLRWEAEIANTTVVGMATEGFAIRDLAVASGRFFDAEEDRARRRLAVVGPTAAHNLFGNTDPVGLQIQIGRVPFEVIGLMQPKGMDPNGTDQDDLVVVPLETAMRRLMNITYVQTIFVKVRTGESSGRSVGGKVALAPYLRAEEEIRELLRQRHRLGDKSDDFTILNQGTFLRAQQETSRSLALLTGGVAAISLLVGGVGILAVMLISVRARTREIGLRRALGARRRDIRNQFLLESVILAATGGGIGILAGVACTLLVSTLGYWEAIISWPAATVGFAFSVAIGMIFGIYPAVRVARHEPIKALRYE
jgi:putative ABC transport system permease protein